MLGVNDLDIQVTHSNYCIQNASVRNEIIHTFNRQHGRNQSLSVSAGRIHGRSTSHLVRDVVAPPSDCWLPSMSCSAGLVASAVDETTGSKQGLPQGSWSFPVVVK